MYGGVNSHFASDTTQSGQCINLDSIHRGWNTQLHCTHLLGPGSLDVPTSAREFSGFGTLPQTSGSQDVSGGLRKARDVG